MIRAWAVSLLAAALAASEPAAPPVRLDVVVTSSTGAPILDLRPGDFELRENGVLRPISAVELRTKNGGATEPTAIASAEDEGRAAREPGTRVFAFVLDEFHVTPGPASERVRGSIAQFIESGLRPGDLAAAIKPLDNLGNLRFTRDRDALLQAVSTFDGRKGDYTPRSTFEEQYIGHAPATIEAARSQIVSAALRAIALRLGELRADRGVVVLVSEGFSRRVPAARQMRVGDLQGLVRAASRFHLALYPYNPADADPAAPPGAEQSTLQWLASETGGRAVLDGAELASGLRRMAADLDAYYAITYEPARADGRFHALELTAKRRNAHVRARPGYWAALSSELRALMDVPTVPVARRALRRSTAVNIWTGLAPATDGNTRLTITWEPRGAQAASRLEVKAAVPDGRVLFDGAIGPVDSNGGTDATHATFDVPAGRVELDMNVVSIGGTSLDTDVRDVEVPVLAGRGKAPLIFTPEIVRGRTTPEFRALNRDPFASPTPSRLFARGDRLLIRVPVWNSSASPVQVAATVANAAGGPMRALDPSGNTDDGRTRFELPLAWLAPGDYQILLTAKNEAGEAREAVRFSVR